METRVFYMIEDDYDISSLYPTKEKWLESVRYNLDVAVEYEDISQETSDRMYEEAVNNALGENDLQTNGFYYSVQEVSVLYFANENLVVRYCDYNKEVYFYTWGGESYDFQEEDVVSNYYEEEQVKAVVNKFVRDLRAVKEKLVKEIMQVLKIGE